MKNRLYSIAILVISLIPFVGPWEGAPLQVGKTAEGIFADQAAYQNAASFMPVLDWDMSDLDVRDSQNRPVRDNSQLQGLTDLFINDLFNLAVTNSLHSMRQIWTDVELFSRLFHDLFFNLVYAFGQTILEAWQPPSKRFVHNVYNLWITLSVGIFLCGFVIKQFLPNISLQKLILRC